MDMEPWRHRDMDTWTHGYMDMETWTWRHGINVLGNSEALQQKNQTGNGTRKPGQFSVFHLPFANCASGNLSFVRLLRKNKRSYLFANGAHGPYGLENL